MVVFIFFLLQLRRALETGSDNSGRLSRAAATPRLDDRFIIVERA